MFNSQAKKRLIDAIRADLDIRQQTVHAFIADLEIRQQAEHAFIEGNFKVLMDLIDANFKELAMLMEKMAVQQIESMAEMNKILLAAIQGMTEEEACSEND